MKLPVAKNLPEEFALSNYEICTSWGAKEWYQALSIRYEMFFCDNKYNDQYWAECGIDRKSVIKDLLAHPLPIEKDGSSFECYEPEYNPVSDQTIAEFFLGAIMVGTNRDYRQLYQKFYAAARGQANPDQVCDDGLRKIEESYPAWKFHKKYSSHANGPHEEDQLSQFLVMVDLRASDELIKFQFDQWLKKTRSAASLFSQPNLNQDKLSSWHRNSYLPYIDLYVWSRLNNLRIPYGDYLDALFPDDQEKPEEYIRKTCSKNALGLLKPDVIFALQTEAHRAVSSR